MDKVKKILAGAQKNIFWIVSGLTVVLGIVGYWLSRSTMDKVFTEQSTKINEQYTALNAIRNELPTHPNSKSHAEMDKIIAGLEDDVQKAWALQYERQAPLLQWPPAQILSERVVNKLKKFRPIELTLEYPLEPAKDPLVRNDLVQYKAYFDKQFPRLAEIIGCKWVGQPPVGAAGGGMMGGYGGMPGGGGMEAGYTGGSEGSSGDMSMAGMPGMGGGMAMGGMGGQNMPRIGPDGKVIQPDLVIWPKGVQDAVIADVQTWRGEPTTLDVLYTQENIWLLEGLLRIIANVNAKVGAAANFQCTVKRIDFIRIGRTAVGRVGTIDPPVSSMPMASAGSMDAGMMGTGMDMGSSSEGSSDAGMMGGMMDMGSSAEGGDAGMGGMAPMTIDPANGRYVDAAYKPLTGDDLRSKMKSESPEDAYFAVAKRVPVRMRFLVDQRRLQSLLAECGNANLMLEIRQLRIGDTIPASASGMGMGMGMGMMGGSSGAGASMDMPGMGGYGSEGGAMGGMGGGGGSIGSYGDLGMGGALNGAGGGGAGMSGMGAGMPGAMGGGVGGGPAPIITSPFKTWDVPVEIYGVVYLFNPPDKAKLGLNKVTADTEVTDKVDVPADQVKPAEGTLIPETPVADPNATKPNAGQAGAQPNGQAGAGGAGQPNAPQQAQPNPGQPNPGQPNAGVPGAAVPPNGGPAAPARPAAAAPAATP